MAPKNDPPVTLSVPDAGRKYFNIGRNASYRAAEAASRLELDGKPRQHSFG
jgi:hypothetical protein